MGSVATKGPMPMRRLETKEEIVGDMLRLWDELHVLGHALIVQVLEGRGGGAPSRPTRPNCPKCGLKIPKQKSGDGIVWMAYHKGSSVICPKPEEPSEHVHYYCRCGYDWMVEPRDVQARGWVERKAEEEKRAARKERGSSRPPPAPKKFMRR
jgi:hypothetical protein